MDLAKHFGVGGPNAAAALLTLPVALHAALYSVAVLGAVVGAVGFGVFVAHPRVFWTHHRIDLDDAAEALAKRLLVRLGEVWEGIWSHRSEIARKLRSVYPPPGVPARDGAGSEGTALAALKDAVLTASSKSSAYAKALDLCSRAAPTAAVRELALRDRMADVPRETQRALCAIADVRLIALTCVDKLRAIHARRTRKLDLPGTVWYHTREDVADYRANVVNSFKHAQTRRRDADEHAVRMIGAIDRFASGLMTGKREGFINKILKPFKVVFDVAKQSLSIVGAVAKITIAVFRVLTESLDDIVLLLKAVFAGLRRILREFRKGPVEGAKALVLIAVGFVVKLTLVVAKPLIRLTLVALLMYTYPCMQVAIHTVVFGAVFAVKLALAVADYQSGGRLRCLSDTDEHPESWWRVPGWERGNRHDRNMVSWRPCARGYMPTAGGVMCRKCDGGLPAFSPAAILMRAYVSGGWSTHTLRTTPARRPATMRAFQRLRRDGYDKAFAGPDGKHVRELVAVLAMCRRSVLRSILGRGAIDEVAYYATGEDDVHFPDISRPPGPSAWAIVGVSAAIVAVAAIVRREAHRV